MLEKRINGIQYLAFKKLEKYKGIRDFVSTRVSGDMAYKPDRPNEYIVNRRNFLELFEIDLENAVFCEQIHKNRVEVVYNNFFKDNGENLNVMSQADGLVTSQPGICLAVRSADCVPIILYDPIKNILGVAHSGWRGTLSEITKHTIEKMQMEYKVNPSDVIACIGPSIGQKDYVVKADVSVQFKNAGYDDFLTPLLNDQWLLNLSGINKKQLIDSGVEKKNIETCRISTYSSDKLFSYRKKDPIGHFLTGAILV